MSDVKRKGNKNDQGKPALSLIPKDALYELGIALGYGAKKYGLHNFRNGIEYTALAGAAMRHLAQFMDGEDTDQESGNNHLGHALASLAMLAYMYHKRPEMDDRYKENENEKQTAPK